MIVILGGVRTGKRTLDYLGAPDAILLAEGDSVKLFRGTAFDNDLQALQQYVKSERLSWPQLYEPGGLDSRLANELGVLTLPTMLLIDKSGRVARRNVHVGELEDELGKLLR